MSTNNKDELFRLQHFRNGEQPPGIYAAISFICERESHCLSKILSVFETFVRYDNEAWPDDEYWIERLPSWLLGTFRKYTQQELIELRADKNRWAQLQWTIGSWLDSMRDREWEWWSLKKTNEAFTLYVTVPGQPYSVQALEHLITAAGGRINQENETE